jgi:hypothetical protein
VTREAYRRLPRQGKVTSWQYGWINERAVVGHIGTSSRSLEPISFRPLRGWRRFTADYTVIQWMGRGACPATAWQIMKACVEAGLFKLDLDQHLNPKAARADVASIKHGPNPHHGVDRDGSHQDPSRPARNRVPAIPQMLFGPEKLLEAIGVCRSEAIAAKRMHRSKSGMARCLQAMVEEVDAVTELITGRLDFHDQGSRPNRP